MFLCLDHQVGLEENIEGLSELCFDLTVLVHVELLEERLVELTPELRWGVAVELVAVLNESQAPSKGLLDLLEGQIGSRQHSLGSFHLFGDAVLFILEEVHRHRVGVVGVEQLLALAIELLKPTRSDSLGVLGAAAQVFEVLAEQGVQQLRVLRMESEGTVLGFDFLFDLMYRHIASDAVRSLLMTTDAEEVPVDRAVPIGLLVEAEPAAAGAAEDGAAEVVREASVLLTRSVGVEHGLHFVEQLSFDERLVVARMLDALPVDVADVVGVAQHPLECRTRQRPLG